MEVAIVIAEIRVFRRRERGWGGDPRLNSGVLTFWFVSAMFVEVNGGLIRVGANNKMSKTKKVPYVTSVT